MGLTINKLSQEISKSKEYADSKFGTISRDIQHRAAEVTSSTVGALQAELMSRSPDRTLPGVPASDDVRSEKV
jgi:hypothetical protein